jgi:WhiB family transcriptional regulator, redox-sensing transcriptional regulator
MLETMEWKELAKCWGRTTSPETDYWYPDPEEPEPVRRSKTATAKAICHICPVKVPCRDYAIEAGEVYGIWGGMTPRDRTTFKRKRAGGSHR